MTGTSPMLRQGRDPRRPRPPRARSGRPFPARLVRRIGVAAIAALLCWLAMWAVSGLMKGPAAWSDPVAPMVSASLVGLAILGYIAWPSRWNVPAHMQLGFAITAYVLPTLVGTSLSTGPRDVYHTYAAVIILGFACSAVGTAVGAELPVPQRLDLPSLVSRTPRGRVRQRTLVLALLAAGVLVGCFVVMGFVPAFVSSDPLDAKFFRGAFAVRYEPVAAFYRGAVSALVVVMPIATLYSLWRRKWYWFATLLGSVALLVCTLQRGNVVSGVLLVVGVALATLRSRKPIYAFAVALVAVYGLGSASWLLLQALGLGTFYSASSGGANLVAIVAAGAPDVTDHLQFLNAWLQHPSLTWGRTFYGGMLPSHYAWNPAVWTLAVEHPGTPLAEISSGGLRLPAPLWGLVSFGWPGVVAVSALSGLAIGVVSAAVRRVVELRDREVAVLAVVLYSASIDVVGQFYTLSYSNVFELALLAAIVAVPRWWPWRLGRAVTQPRGSRRSRRAPGPATSEARPLLQRPRLSSQHGNR